jgi:hypothetical protein
MKMEQTECSETSAYRIQMPGNYPEENIQHGFCFQSLTVKSRLTLVDVQFDNHIAHRVMLPAHLSVQNVLRRNSDLVV